MIRLILFIAAILLALAGNFEHAFYLLVWFCVVDLLSHLFS